MLPMNIRMWRQVPGVKKFFGCLLVFGIASNLLLLLYYPPKMLDAPCPLVVSRDEPQTVGNAANLISQPVKCDFVYDENHRSKIPSHKWCHRHDAVSDADYLQMASNCSQFIEQRKYNRHPVTDEERRFPLAFSILMHVQVEQAERLLHAIYRPHNVYCIHVDGKSAASVQVAVRAIASCLPNVFVASRTISVHWAEFSVLEAELICLNDLLEYKNWKYYINLAGTEFPLRTNLELVKILKAYQGANEIDGSPSHRPLEWTQYSWRREYWRTNTLKSPPPHGYVIAKGSTHLVASREFINYTLHDRRALDLLSWMKDIRCPDEHFFQTLNSNPRLGAPGAYTANPDLRDGFYVRYKVWKSPGATCHGKWVDFICVLAAGDLHQAVRSRHMFLNKLNLDMDPVAFQCLEQWYHERAQRGTNPDFDLEFYKSRKLVKYHI